MVVVVRKAKGFAWIVDHCALWLRRWSGGDGREPGWLMKKHVSHKHVNPRSLLVSRDSKYSRLSVKTLKPCQWL